MNIRMLENRVLVKRIEAEAELRGVDLWPRTAAAVLPPWLRALAAKLDAAHRLIVDEALRGLYSARCEATVRVRLDGDRVDVEVTRPIVTPPYAESVAIEDAEVK